MPDPQITQFQANRPLSVWEVIAREYEELRTTDPLGGDYHARLLAHATEEKEAFIRQQQKKTDCTGESQREEAARQFRNLLIARLHDAGTSAICFSGGGIRSATFGLGVIQELARQGQKNDAPSSGGILPQLEYVSTVSGGGYLGAWFSSWAYHHKNTQSRVTDGVAGVVAELGTTPDKKIDPEPEPVLHLRRYSAYLSPRLGVSSADTWTLGATVLRNITINWLVFFPALVCVLALPQLVHTVTNMGGSEGARQILLGLSIVLAAFAVVYVFQDLPSVGDTRRSQGNFLRQDLLPLGIASLLVSIYFSWLVITDPHHTSNLGLSETLGCCIGILVVGYVIGMVVVGLKEQLSWRRVAWGFPAVLLTGAGAGLITYALADGLTPMVVGNSKLYTTLAPPAVFAILGAVSVIFVALSSRVTTDEDREWWARSSAWLFIVPVVWLAFSGLVLQGSDLLLRAWGAKGIAVPALGTGVFGTIASLLGLSPKTASGPEENARAVVSAVAKSDKLREWAIKLILPAFLILLAVTIASILPYFQQLIAGELDRIYVLCPYVNAYSWLALVLASLMVAYLLGLLVDPNKFSLHAMYRARLIRAYLGASNPHRNPNLFTGFDPDDNLHLKDLRQARPLHIVNMALNLVASSNLAWQQRKAESFTASRLHCGSLRLGYQPAAHYGHPGGMTLGGAITISGAAASPNMGYHSSPLLSVIMTLFNARLGAWLANPGWPGHGIWEKAGPTNAVRPFIDEAFGLTNDDNAWVYLSDGGHFENLGLYEMVLRRCHSIIVVDASADPKFSFEDLGNAVRKIRIDLGIPIEFPQGMPIYAHSADTRHCAVGTIQYHCVDGGVEDGTLIYLKPSLNGNEPPDVRNYSSQYSSFPHETTADQWFTESQFESYRRLGAHIIEEICSGQAVSSLADFVDHVQRHLWHPSAEVSRHFTKHALVYDALIERLRKDPNLSPLDRAMFPEFKRGFGSELGTFIRALNPLNDQQKRSIFLFCNSLMQLMENVYLDLNLEHNEDDRNNAGWLQVFENWATSPHFQEAWRVSSSTYGEPFRRFCHRRFQLPFIEVKREKGVS
jgi:hypothetical protein